ncbi:MAG: SLOG family protein [Bacillota bacterium]
MESTAVCFTGYRPQKLPWGEDESDPRCRELKLRLLAAANAFAEDGAVRFLCGMARGVDLYAAEAVLLLKQARPEVALECVLPFRGQGEGYRGIIKARYHGILEQADAVTVLSEAYHPLCMLARNRYMVDHAQSVIAVYDGASGGTRQTIEYARKMGRAIKIISP